MKKLILIKVALIMGFGLVLFSAAQLKWKKEISGSSEQALSLSELEAYIQTIVEQKSPPGLSIAVVKDKNIVYTKGFGYADIPKHKKATPETVYQWWSLTKPFTAVAILQLQEKGLLNINEPVRRYLPFFHIKETRKAISEITIQQLLSHSSGLDDIGMKIISWIHYEDDEPFDQTQLVKEQLPRYNKLKSRPGEQGRYSNLGYMILAALVEQVSGQSYDSYIKENILQPLEMDHTGFSYSQEMKKRAATGSHPKDLMSLFAFIMIDKQKAIREKEEGIYWFNTIYSNQQGSTGLIGSAEDLSHFMIAILNNGGWKNTRILSPQSVQMMQEPFMKVDKSPATGLTNPYFGLSWFIHDTNHRIALSHAGAGAAFVAQMRLYPKEKLGIAVMANSTYLEKDMGSEIINKLAEIEWRAKD